MVWVHSRADQSRQSARKQEVRPENCLRPWFDGGPPGGTLGARATSRVIVGCGGAKIRGHFGSPGKNQGAAPGIRVLNKPSAEVGRPSPVSRLGASARLLFSKGREDIVGERNEPAVPCPIGFGRGPQHSLQSHEKDFGQHGSLLVKHSITL